MTTNSNVCEMMESHTSEELPSYDLPAPDPKTNEIKVLPNLKVSTSNFAKAICREEMSKRAKLLVKMRWPDKGIRLQLGFDKSAPGVKILISDQEVTEIRDLCLKCEKMRNNVLKEGDKRYPKLKQIKKWISGTLIDECHRE
ncbi:GSCOCG00012948001-RA-CDS [Cotesia congregata]|uniref:Uncharacterized protein n=1 Tax=Cotesia congregata TaxID=51543 RepID=A0A8J2HSH5_COTCN|nr:GSCOCG00012948001-RA-CDS [Cotesia congregata]CAG5087602.1 Protein of unknown function [Cotesia congregata]CAG5109233.1 Protein of unknown function [Cotesia congregata]